MCNGDDVILNQLFNVMPMKGFEHWGDVRMFASTVILNMLKALNLGDG